MVPMIRGEVEERQQGRTILDQAFDGLVVFGRVFLGECRHRRFRRGPVRRQPDLAQILVRVERHRLRELVEHVECLVQPASLMTRRRERLVERFPEPERAIADGGLRRDGQAARFQVDKQFLPALRALLQARSREVSVGPRRPVADRRAQEAGLRAGDLRKSDTRFGGRVRGPAASRAHRRLRRSSSQGKREGCWSLCRHAGSDCGANRRDDGSRCDRRGHETDGKGLGGLQPADDYPRRRPADRARPCGCDRRSFAHPSIPRCRRLSGPGPKAVSVGRGRLRRQQSRNAGTGACEPCCTRPPMSC